MTGMWTYDGSEPDPSLDRLVADLDVVPPPSTLVVPNGARVPGWERDGVAISYLAVLRYLLRERPAAEFDATAVWSAVDRLRTLVGWTRLGHQLVLWVHTRLRDPYFENVGTTWEPRWVRIPGTDQSLVPEDHFRFACSIATGALRYGPSHSALTTAEIFAWVSDLGSDLPATLKKHGTGALPPELRRFRANGVDCTANDALATVRVRLTEESVAAYAAVLDYLDRLLRTDFPRSYAIEFRGQASTYLPIKGLPRKGVHRLFASAAAHPELWQAIERYARVAMREFEWYTDIDHENPAMPGTFAVFALGLADTGFAPLVVDYLTMVDGEHQELQARFVTHYLDTRGFTAEAISYLVACAGNIQELPHRTAYAAMAADDEVLSRLLAAKRATPSHTWNLVRHVIWGDRKPKNVHSRYVELFDE